MNTTIRLTLLLGALSLVAARAETQYFGRNAVQYETFNFKILRTQHFDVYFYDKEAEAAAEAARMAERWYARLSTLLRHQLNGRQPLILYADHPDFEQTNVIGEQPGEGTGGVTESLKRRIILPMGASLAETDHVIGHELVHAFQYDITGVGRGSIATGLNRVPLWFVEGMAEYLSIGPVDPNTTMWVRDAVRRGELPKFGDLANFKYFPYRWGQAFWAYLGGTYGDDIVGAMLRAGGKTGNVQAALEQMTHRPADSVVADWHREVTANAQAVAVATGVELPADKARARREREIPVTARGARLLVSPGKERHYNLAPAVSPDGQRMVYLSDAGLFSIDMYLADATTGRTIRRLVSSTRDPHLESMQFINSAGAWAPDGSRFVFGAVVTGQPALRIVNASNGDVVKEIKFPALGEIFNPTWSPDGKMIAFSAQVGGLTDLFTYDLDSGQQQRLTQDPFADLEPAWSPDGSRIAFVTDRFGTSLDKLSFGNYRLALIDARGGGRITPLPNLGEAKHINPQWSPDGNALYFLADPGGITNVFRLTLAGGAAGITQVTNVYTGISGITPLSPALSVAQKTPRAVFTVYTGGGYAIQTMDDVQALAGGPVRPLPAATAILPPVQRDPAANVTTIINNPEPGLPQDVPVLTSNLVKSYKPKLSLDFIAQPNLAIAADRFGTYIGGGVTLYWSDMMGDHSLVTMAQFQGRIKDFAALVAYGNRRSRWNWVVGAQQIPYIEGFFANYIDGFGRYVEEVERFTRTSREAGGVVAYPFNRSRRLEFSAGIQQVSYDHELTKRGFNPDGSLAFDSTIHFPVPGAVTLEVGSVALVHDNSFFGATSPILGDRWRLEAAPTFGSLQFVTALADYRKYLMPVRPFTLAGRVLHVGRYGRDSDDGRMYPLFIGYSSLVRGYDVNSFDASECQGGSPTTCPVFDQLWGSRMIVANAEVRFPPLGLLGAGGGYYGAVPLEAAFFYDAGVAWTAARGAQLFGNGRRRIVRSAGATLRLNLLGYAIGQVDFVRPFDRPQKNWLIRFSLTPGF